MTILLMANAMLVCLVGAVLVSPKAKRMLASWLIADAQYQENMAESRRTWRAHKQQAQSRTLAWINGSGSGVIDRIENGRD